MKKIRKLSKHLPSELLHRDNIRKGPRYGVPLTASEVASVWGFSIN
jgi:hypothetical protein